MSTEIITSSSKTVEPDEHGGTKIERMYAEIVSEAEREVRKSSPRLHGKPKDAHVALYMVKDIITRRASLRTITATIMVAVGRDGLWKYLPASDINPSGVKDAKGFLREAGMPAHGTFYELAMIGDEIAPYAERHGIDLAPLLTQDNCGKFMEAVSFIRKQIVEGKEPRQIEATLDKVVSIDNVRAARKEFREQRERDSKGKVNHVGDAAIVSILVPDKEDVGVIVEKLRSLVEFNLDASAIETESTFEVLISKWMPQQ
jgi:hypothetical protein